MKRKILAAALAGGILWIGFGQTAIGAQQEDEEEKRISDFLLPFLFEETAGGTLAEAFVSEGKIDEKAVFGDKATGSESSEKDRPAEKTGTVLDDIQVHSYDPNENYMEKMYQASLDGSEYAMEAGAIYEAQRNLKISREGLSQETTDFFSRYKDSAVLQKEIKAFLGLEEPSQWLVMSVPSGIDTAFKAYMDYTTITSKASTQYQLQQQAYTENGFRMLQGCYLVALGSYYGSCGDRFRITFDSGNTIEAIMGDVKADCHTDASRMYRPMSSGRGNVVEFIVDSRYMDPTAKKMGDVSHALPALGGNVVKIEKWIGN